MENSQRARQVLAIITRTGQFLPICLTFGPANGPDDFALVIDRLYAPGKQRRMELMRTWLPYVDDLTIRSGRMVGSVAMTDEEAAGRLETALRSPRAAESFGQLDDVQSGKP